MARAMWTGSVSFGLVNVPVRLYSATEDHQVHFRQFEEGTSSRIRYQRVNEDTGEEVDYSDIAKAAEVGDGEYVLITREQLELWSRARAAPSTSVTSSTQRRSTPSTTRRATTWRRRTRRPCTSPTRCATVPRRSTGCPRAPLARQEGRRHGGQPHRGHDHKTNDEEIVTQAEPAESGQVLDLLGALQASLDASQGHRPGNQQEGTQDLGTRRARTSGSGEGDLTKAELYDRAQELDVPGRSSMSKAQLVRAVADARKKVG